MRLDIEIKSGQLQQPLFRTFSLGFSLAFYSFLLGTIMFLLGLNLLQTLFGSFALVLSLKLKPFLFSFELA